MLSWAGTESFLLGLVGRAGAGGEKTSTCLPLLLIVPPTSGPESQPWGGLALALSMGESESGAIKVDGDGAGPGLGRGVPPATTGARAGSKRWSRNETRLRQVRISNPADEPSESAFLFSSYQYRWCSPFLSCTDGSTRCIGGGIRAVSVSDATQA